MNVGQSFRLSGSSFRVTMMYRKINYCLYFKKEHGNTPKVVALDHFSHIGKSLKKQVAKQ